MGQSQHTYKFTTNTKKYARYCQNLIEKKMGIQEGTPGWVDQNIGGGQHTR